MAVSRTFIRGINSSAFSSSLLRPSGTYVAGAAATPSPAYSSNVSSRGASAVAGPSSQPICSGGGGSSVRSYSSSAPSRKDNSKPQDIRIPREKMEKMMPEGDVGHDMAGDEGSHGRRTLKSFSMENKVCVVTGAARGLGNVMARAFIESGADTVAFLDLSAEDAQNAADESAQWFADENPGSKAKLNLIGVECDVANEDSVKRAFERIHKHYGRIDTVVNSAGIVENFPAQSYETSRYQKLMDINMNGSWYISNEAGRYMMQDGVKGSIILVASMSASIVNVPQLQAPYNASKAAVKHLASCLGVEWATKGIRVNSLSPGYMLTSLTRVMTEKSEDGRALRRAWESKIPSGRMGDPEDLKGAAVFLASDASGYVTATDLLVDGGYCAV